MAETKSTFSILNVVDVKEKVKTKNNLTYLPWSSAWAEIMKLFPDSSWRIIPQIDGENTRFWHDDGRTGWVEVGVTINGKEIIETLAVMDYKNKSIPADQITSVDANKSVKRCLVKAIAMHGLGLYIYEGEDLPEESAKIIELQEECMELVRKKCALSDKAKARVGELCKAAEKEFDPMVDDADITGNPKNIDDAEILTNLKKQLLAVRK